MTVASNGGQTLALPVIESLQETPERITELQAEIRKRARARNAVVLAHNYQRPEIQDVTDEVGDILHLGPLVVMRENDRVALAGERPDFGL